MLGGYNISNYRREWTNERLNQQERNREHDLDKQQRKVLLIIPYPFLPTSFKGRIQV
jgi:hypothetical protein